MRWTRRGVVGSFHILAFWYLLVSFVFLCSLFLARGVVGLGRLGAANTALSVDAGRRGRTTLMLFEAILCPRLFNFDGVLLFLFVFALTAGP